MFDDHINVAITAWATIALFLATAIGFGFVACQAAELKITIADEALNTLYNQYSEMLSLLCTKPHLYPYIYGDAELSERDIQEHPTLRAEINLICETILALIEHSLIFNRKLSRDAWNNCWKPYAEERFGKSKELCQFFEKNRNWYAKSLQDFYATIPKR